MFVERWSSIEYMEMDAYGLWKVELELRVM